MNKADILQGESNNKMQIAVLSDIHGNHVAFEACVEEVLKRNINIFIFLGDYVGELAYPQKTMELLYSLKEKYECHFLRGNKEDYWIDYRNAGETGWKYNDSTTGSMLYAYDNLTKEDLDFFERLSHAEMITFEGMPAVAAYHGSHNKAGEKLPKNKDNTISLLGDTDKSLILCGHTHIQSELIREGRQILNPGSVGVPLNSNGKAQFMILSGENGIWQHEFVSMLYDTEKAIQEIYEDGLDKKAPFWCRVTENLLRKGNISHGTVLAKAMKLLYQDTGEWRWPDIPEVYWERAVKELGL